MKEYTRQTCLFKTFSGDDVDNAAVDSTTTGAGPAISEVISQFGAGMALSLFFSKGNDEVKGKVMG